jgi:type IV pilus assembly protein PilY1
MITPSGGVSRESLFIQKAVLFISTVFILSLPFFISLPAGAATMDDYCAVPPFIASGGVPPNVLLTIDNSASMFDLTYADEGNYEKSCAIAAATPCTTTQDCPNWEVTGDRCIISNFTREPSYCYDQTFKSRVCSETDITSCTVDADCPAGETCVDNIYAGYFENKVCSVTTSVACEIDADCPKGGGETCVEALYTYTKCPGGDPCVEFEFDPDFPAEPAVSVCDRDYYLPNTLCLDFDEGGGEKALNGFWASGNFLNWLSSSKFDVQKKILTGGKFDTTSSELHAESRGCVGRRFIKEPNKADFVNYIDGGVNTNESLGVTFAVRGARHSINPTAPSPGGQTVIEIFEGDYEQELCQEAIDAFVALHDPASIRRAVEACLSFAPAGGTCTIATDGMGNPLPCSNNVECKDASGDNKDRCDEFGAGETVETKRKVVFQQSIQACWQYLRWLQGLGGNDIGVDEANTVLNQCNEIYPAGTCSDGFTSCNNDNDCTDPDTCNYGPDGILGGNPGLLCSRNYAGYCYDGTDPWPPDAWVGREYADEIECIREKHREFCGDLDIPPVIDPTDDASDATLFDNLPAILGDVAIETQLGEPILLTNADTPQGAEPLGVIQKFSRNIRFGAMTFNFQGSGSECVLDSKVDCPRVCRDHTDLPCVSAADCPDFLTGETCIDSGAVPDVNNYDGAKIIHYIGADGICSVNTGTACDEDIDCPDFLKTAGTPCDRDIECPGAGEKCNTTLINRIDGIRAETWTPFSEAMYNSIGYFARMDDHTTPPSFGISRGDVRINPPDFDLDKNPSQFICQSNNVLLITDGMPTTDLRG